MVGSDVFEQGMAVEATARESRQSARLVHGEQLFVSVNFTPIQRNLRLDPSWSQPIELLAGPERLLATELISREPNLSRIDPLLPLFARRMTKRQVQVLRGSKANSLRPNAMSKAIAIVG